MKLTAILLNAAVFFVIVVLAYRILRETLRKKACYQMYAVRDDLIYLVATGALKEKEKVFEYYYSRVNGILSKAPNVGLDNLLHFIFIRWEEGKDFKKMIEDAEKRAERLYKDPAFQNPEVCRVVSDYYSSVRNMILAHSSLLRAIFLIIKHFAKRLDKHLAERLDRALTLPGDLGRAMITANYADNEARTLQQLNRSASLAAGNALQ